MGVFESSKESIQLVDRGVCTVEVQVPLIVQPPDTAIPDPTGYGSSWNLYDELNHVTVLKACNQMLF